MALLPFIIAISLVVWVGEPILLYRVKEREIILLLFKTNPSLASVCRKLMTIFWLARPECYSLRLFQFVYRIINICILGSVYIYQWDNKQGTYSYQFKTFGIVVQIAPNDTIGSKCG